MIVESDPKDSSQMFFTPRENSCRNKLKDIDTWKRIYLLKKSDLLVHCTDDRSENTYRQRKNRLAGTAREIYRLVGTATALHIALIMFHIHVKLGCL